MRNSIARACATIGDEIRRAIRARGRTSRDRGRGAPHVEGRLREVETSWSERAGRAIKGMGAILLVTLCVVILVRLRAVERERAGIGVSAPAQERCREDQVNLNTASISQLEALPGIGPLLAEEIVRHRERHGPFRRVEEVMIVRGIGPRKRKALSPHICVE